MSTERKLARLDRVFARLDREAERPTHIDEPKMSRHRIVLLVAALAFYFAIVWAVVITSWLVRLDWQVMFFRPYQQWPEIHAFLDYYVVLGQRGPTAVMISAWLGWRAWRQRTLRPLLVFAVALLLLNVTVGAAKIGMGRLGPHYATTIGSNEMGLGGDIFPSGHTANAVVTWGILAYLASTPWTRRWLSAGSALMSLAVGLTTVYLGTHWLSDVVLGWVAGLLILLALPWFEPLITRTETWILSLRDRRRAPGPGAAPAPARVGTPAMFKPRAIADEEATTREDTTPAARSSHAPIHPSGLAPGPHTSRAERTPVTPAGSRRPPHADRVPRGTGSTTGTPSARPLPGNS